MTTSQRFSASWDGMNRAASTLVLTLTGAVAVLLWSLAAWGVGGLPVWAWAALGFVPGAIVGGCWLFAPQGYLCDERGVVVRRAGPDVVIRWEEIESIEPTEGRVQWVRKASVRLAGVSGLFGWYGAFYREGKAYRMYATRLSPLVVIRRRDRWPVVLSPDDPDGFIEAVRERIGSGAGSGRPAA